MTSRKVSAVLPRPRVVLALDWFILTLVVCAVVIDMTGGFDSAPWGIRISAHRTDRALFAAIALFVLRRRLGPRELPFGGRLGNFDAIRRLFDRRLEPKVSAVHAPTAHYHFLWALLGFISMGTVLLRRQLAQMDAVPDLGDPLFSVWRMGWVFHQLKGGVGSLFNANIFYPEPLTLTYSDSMLIPSLIEAPLLAAGIAPIIAYNLLLLCSFGLSALATYLLVVRLTGSARAAFIAGLVYGFYPYRFEHYSHLELQFTCWMPLGLLAVHHFAETPRLRYALLAMLCEVAQLYSSMYYAVFFPFYAIAVFAILLYSFRRSVRAACRPVAIAGAVGILMATPLARPYLSAQLVKGEREPYVVSFYSAKSSDYLKAHERSALYGGRLLSDPQPERALFPGLTPLLLSALGATPPVGAVRLAYLGGLALALDLSKGFNGLLYRHLYALFPPIRGMRVPARMSIVLAISLAVLAGFGIRRLMSRCSGPVARAIAFSASVAAVAIDLSPKLELQPVWLHPPSIYSAIAADPNAVIAEFPFETKYPWVTSNVQYMYFSLWHWRPLLNGYSGFTSREYDDFVMQLADFPGPTSLKALRRRGATHVSVNCAFMSTPCQPLLDRIELSGIFRPISSAMWQRSPVRLYELLTRD